jgi:hypothetical protein
MDRAVVYAAGEGMIQDTPLDPDTARALGVLITPSVEKLPSAPAPKHEPLFSRPLVVMLVLMIIVGVLLLAAALAPGAAQAASLPAVSRIATGTPRPILPTQNASPTVSPTPSATATTPDAAQAGSVPAQPKWMTESCLFEIESIVDGEAGIVGGDALVFVGENVLRDAYRLQCVGLSRRWYAVAKNGISDAARAATNDVLTRWPATLWPVCDFVVGALDVPAVLSKYKTTIDIIFASDDHRWGVIGMGCR